MKIFIGMVFRLKIQTSRRRDLSEEIKFSQLLDIITQMERKSISQQEEKM